MKRKRLGNKLRNWFAELMKKMNPELEIAVQRLVDNELDDQQLADLLSRAEQHPQIWRMATLAFIEERVFSSVARQVSIEKQQSFAANDKTARQSTSSTTDSRASKPGFTHHGAGTANAVKAESVSRVGPELASEKQNSLASSEASRSRWPRYATQMMLTAALVLLALNVALQFNPVRRGDPTADSSGSAGGMLADKGHPNDLATEPNDSNLGSQQNLVSNEPYQLQLGDAKVPLHAGRREEMLRMLQAQSEMFDPGISRRMLDLGYQVQPDIRYISGKSEDGRSFIVPIQSYRLRRSIQ